MLITETFRRFFRKEALRNFLKIFSGAVFVQTLALALSPLYARLFTPEDFGLAALYLSIFSVVSVLATARYEQAIMLPRSDMDARALFWLVQILAMGFSLIVLIVVAVFGSPIAAISGNARLEFWLWILPFGIVLYGISQSCMYYANRTKQFGIITQSTIVQGVTLNGVRVISGFLRTPVNGLLIGQIVAQIFATLHIAWRNRKLLAGIGDTSLVSVISQAKVYVAYPKYNMLLNFTNNLSGALPVLLFTRGFSAEAAGLFAFGYTFIFKPLTIFSQSLSQVLSQQIIEHHNQGKPILVALQKLLKRQFWVGVIPFILLAILAPTLFKWFFPQAFHLAGVYIQVLTPWFFMVYLTSPLAFIPELLNGQKKAMKIDIMYLILRFLALTAGIMLESILLSLVFFSAVSTWVVGYNLYWYLHLASKHDIDTTSIQK